MRERLVRSSLSGPVMQPLVLTLKGFRGIRAGLGLDVLTLDFERHADAAQLVAIAGANRRRKSTVMDNMRMLGCIRECQHSWFDRHHRLQ